jgi:hypothetical protein
MLPLGAVGIAAAPAAVRRAPGADFGRVRENKLVQRRSRTGPAARARSLAQLHRWLGTGGAGPGPAPAVRLFLLLTAVPDLPYWKAHEHS